MEDLPAAAAPAAIAPNWIENSCGVCHDFFSEKIDVFEKNELLLLLVVMKMKGHCGTSATSSLLYQNKTRYCLTHFFEAGRELKKIVEEESEASIGTRIVEMIARTICRKAIVPGTLRSSIETFMDKFGEHREKEYRVTLLLKTVNYKQYEVEPHKKQHEIQRKCVMCAEMIFTHERMHLVTCQDKFFFCLFMSPLVSSVMTFPQALALFACNEISVCRHHKKSEINELRWVKCRLDDQEYREKFMWMAMKMLDSECLFTCLRILNVCSKDDYETSLTKAELLSCMYCKDFYGGGRCGNCAVNTRNLLADLQLTTPAPIADFKGYQLQKAVKMMSNYFLIPKNCDTFEKAKILMLVLFLRYSENPIPFGYAERERHHHRYGITTDLLENMPQFEKIDKDYDDKIYYNENSQIIVEEPIQREWTVKAEQCSSDWDDPSQQCMIQPYVQQQNGVSIKREIKQEFIGMDEY